MSNDKTIIIAEAGVNHNGSISLAKKMIDVAASAKVDYVKFQTYRTGSLVSKNTRMAEYQLINSGEKKTQYDLLKDLELSTEDHLNIIKKCNKKEIKFLSSPFDIKSIDFLDSLGLSVFKIPSGEITNYPYLKHIGAKKKKIIISSGMSNLDEIESALNILIKSGTKKDDITVLHCNTDYPTQAKDVNLNAMISIKDKFNIRVGYSDHTLGSEISLAAVSMGASVIEKHFTLDRAMAGPDHAASMEPNELIRLVESIRKIEISFGDGIKKPSLSEKKNIPIARKSIVSKRKINKGDIFSSDNITTKRPGYGISPMKWNEVIGKKAIRDFSKDELIEI
jgi:N,N'-diacetyllegionaminate synthase